MIFVDRVEIDILAGHGGPGSSSFRREKFVPKGGPDGGDGGRGGDVIFTSVSRLQTLMDITLKTKYHAQNGQPGGKKQMFGSNGQNCVIEVPCGTVILDQNGELLADLVTPNQTWVAAKGGKGGKGNVHFATSINRAPLYSQPGLPGESAHVILELRMLAQVGLVGLPNAGKSTLLSAITRANPKIADYPFTTLYPNLGVLKFHDREIVIADIPGLIEGASEGQGLGADFLRHVDRTQTLIHVVAMDLDGPETTWMNYKTVQHELANSSFNLDQKHIIIALNKADMIDPEYVSLYTDLFTSQNIPTVVISGLSGIGISDLIKHLVSAEGTDTLAFR
jgi:GTP-binding protein